MNADADRRPLGQRHMLYYSGHSKHQEHQHVNVSDFPPRFYKLTWRAPWVFYLQCICVKSRNTELGGPPLLQGAVSKPTLRHGGELTLLLKGTHCKHNPKK